MNVWKPHLQTHIWTPLQANTSQREIERVAGISRHTIRAYQQRFAAERANCPGAVTLRYSRARDGVQNTFADGR